jgi:hypothetical protein
MKSAIAVCALLASAGTLSAQRVEARFGALFSSTLARDLGAEPALVNRFPAEYEGPVDLSLAPAPSASVAVFKDLSDRASIEIAGMLAISRLRAESSTEQWDVQDVSVAALTVGIRYATWSRVYMHGGIGVTRFFSESNGIFRAGSGGMPLLELGASTRLRIGALPLSGAVRLQTHNFGTPALRSDRGSDGRVARILIQAGIGG